MLEVENLTRYYSGVAVVRQVSFRVGPGEVLGYLGPNGSGKSTTVKMLTGLVEPDHGDIRFHGASVLGDMASFKRRFGYVPEESQVYPHLTGREYLQLVGRLRSLPAPLLESKIRHFLHIFGLWSDRDLPLLSYSKGMRQKILISSALLHNPELLIFDEPLSGLDATTALIFHHLVQSLAGSGKVVLYTSHEMETIERLATRVLILRQGEIVAHDSVSQLRALMRLPSLQDIFQQLALQDDPRQTVEQIMEVVLASQ